MPFPFSNRTLQFETLRALGYANSGGADANEIFQICARIREGNLDDWFKEWQEAGLRAFKLGEESEELRDHVSARQAFLRASNYLRTAEFFRRDHPEDDRAALEIYDQSREAMYRAMAASPQYSFQRLEVPFEKTAMPIYMLSPAGRKGRFPTVVLNGGFDSVKEEAYLAFGAAALARGYNFVAFDGPGQGEMIRHQGVPFRPDWHVVVSAVTDAVLAQDCVAADQLVLIGWSMGGWLAAQAATKEHRYSALILNDGVLDFSAGWRKRAPAWLWTLQSLNYHSVVSTLVYLSVSRDIGKRWAYQNALYTFGLPNGSALLAMIKEYCLTKDQVQSIRSPLLVLDPQDDHLLGGQPSALIECLSPAQRYQRVVLDTKWGAAQHCQAGALAEQDRVMYNWLATILK